MRSWRTEVLVPQILDEPQLVYVLHVSFQKDEKLKKRSKILKIESMTKYIKESIFVQQFNLFFVLGDTIGIKS